MIDVISGKAHSANDRSADGDRAGESGALLVLPCHPPPHLPHIKSIGEDRAKVIHKGTKPIYGPLQLNRLAKKADTQTAKTAIATEPSFQCYGLGVLNPN